MWHAELSLGTVTNKTIKLKSWRDKDRRKYLVSKSKKSKEWWQCLTPAWMSLTNRMKQKCWTNIWREDLRLAVQDFPIQIKPPTRKETVTSHKPNEEQQGWRTRWHDYSWSTSEWWWHNGWRSLWLLFQSIEYPHPTPPSRCTTSVI